MFFITMIEDLKISSKRCVGYLANSMEAEAMVVNNFLDIGETIYRFCVIEEIGEGFYQYADKNHRQFYEFNTKSNNYDPIREPEEFKELVGFGIG
jgi:hypothetical protein